MNCDGKRQEENGINFEMSDEMKMLKEMAYKFAQTEFASLSQERSRNLMRAQM